MNISDRTASTAVTPNNIVEIAALERMERDRNRTLDVYRENFRRYLKHMHDDAEHMQDYARRLIREGADVSEELKELEIMGNAALLVAALLTREANSVE